MKFLTVALSITSLCPTTLRGEELWAIADAHGKGEDFLYVVNLEKPMPPFRKLRCDTSLPIYIEDIVRAAKRVNSKVLVRVDTTISPEPEGERASDVKVIAVILVPKSTWPLLNELKSWKDFSEHLVEETPDGNVFQHE